MHFSIPWRSLIRWSGPAGGENFVERGVEHFCGNAERAVFSQSGQWIRDFNVFSCVTLGGGVDVDAVSEHGARDRVRGHIGEGVNAGLRVGCSSRAQEEAHCGNEPQHVRLSTDLKIDH